MQFVRKNIPTSYRVHPNYLWRYILFYLIFFSGNIFTKKMGIVFSYLEHMHATRAYSRVKVEQQRNLDEPPPAYCDCDYPFSTTQHIMPLNKQMYAMAKQM